MLPFINLGSGVGDAIASSFTVAFTLIWNAAISLLGGAFSLVDHLSGFTLSTAGGPVHTLWPLTLWISAVLALGLFFWQLAMTSLRAGKGFLRLATGPVQYGIALAITVGLAAGLLTGVDGVTTGILTAGLHTTTFADSLGHLGLNQAIHSGASAVALAVCAVLMVFPAAVGFLLEMIFREAAIYVLVVCIPISAAGLIAVSTQRWFWKVCRWLLALIMMKPALALTVVFGVAMVSSASGFNGVLAGAGVLLISLVAPFVLFKLFAFVDPATDAGAGARRLLSGRGSSYLSNVPMRSITNAARRSGNSPMESGNMRRLQEIVRDHARMTAPQQNTEPHLGPPSTSPLDSPADRKPNSPGNADNHQPQDAGAPEAPADAATSTVRASAAPGPTAQPPAQPESNPPAAHEPPEDKS